jgi:hypothetical protein
LHGKEKGKKRSIKVGEVNKPTVNWHRLSHVNPSSTAMSFPKDDDRGHENAMLDGTRKVNPCGCHMEKVVAIHQ